VSSSANEQTPKEEFDQAVLRFKDFLAHRGFSPNVVWIQPSDLVLTEDGRIFVCHTEEESAAIAARNTFEQGLKQGNGVVLKGVVLKGLFPRTYATYSFVWFPRDHADAESEMVPPGVKLQIGLSLPQHFKVIVIRNRERWQALRQRHGGIQFMKTDLFR
jgi:hypothetical protein